MVAHHQERPVEVDRSSERPVQRGAGVDSPVLVHGADDRGTAERMSICADTRDVQHPGEAPGQRALFGIGVVTSGKRGELVDDEAQIGGANLV